MPDDLTHATPDEVIQSATIRDLKTRLAALETDYRALTQITTPPLRDDQETERDRVVASHGAQFKMLFPRVKTLENDYANLKLTVIHLADLCDTICKVFTKLADVAKSQN